MGHISCWSMLMMRNLLGSSIYAINKYTETLIYASKEVGLEVNAEKAKYMLLSTRVEAGSNTSTVTLRVVRGDEMGLKKAAP
jgi:hypothetical protein